MTQINMLFFALVTCFLVLGRVNAIPFQHPPMGPPPPYQQGMGPHGFPSLFPGNPGQYPYPPPMGQGPPPPYPQMPPGPYPGGGPPFPYGAGGPNFPMPPQEMKEAIGTPSESPENAQNKSQSPERPSPYPDLRGMDFDPRYANFPTPTLRGPPSKARSKKAKKVEKLEDAVKEGDKKVVNTTVMKEILKDPHIFSTEQEGGPISVEMKEFINTPYVQAEEEVVKDADGKVLYTKRVMKPVVKPLPKYRAIPGQQIQQPYVTSPMPGQLIPKVQMPSGPMQMSPMSPQGFPPMPSQGYPPMPSQGFPPMPPQGYPPMPSQGYPPMRFR